MVTFTDHAVYHLEVSDNTTERIKDGVKNQTLQRGLRITFRGRDLLHDRIQDLGHSLACLSARP